MKQKVFTAKFNYCMPTEEFKKGTSASAPKFSEIPGLCWKIWLINEDRKEAGGVYLFESAEALEQFMNGPLFARLTNNPAYINLQTNTFSVAGEPSLITDAPLAKSMFREQFHIS